ncbi:MAG TPA: DUF2130 domain-containing protein [Bacteroidota bacterium]|jgi:hypothetical protein|nr:DUF2130 domain-containing protein [Bacteroidota bacterium]
MPDQFITCPKCGTKIPLTEAFTHDIEEKLRSEYEAELKRKSDESNAALRAMEQEFQETRAKERSRLEAQAKERAQESISIELKDLKEQVQEKSKQLETSRQQELELRKRQRDLEERERTSKLEAERTLDGERKKIREETEIRVSEEHRMRELEKDKQLGDMRKQIEELKRKAEMTSQQAQGEVQEIELEAILGQQFKSDTIEPVPKGIRGADVVQHVNDDKRQPCGKIIWESKRTKAWSEGWIQKLKDDQRIVKAEIAVLVTTTLPKELNRFGYLDGIWVTDFQSAVGLATALRENLVQLAYLRNSMTGRNEKKDLMYDYLSGPQFRQRFEPIVESFIAMKQDLDAEKRAMEKVWSKREAQISRVLKNTAGMYGDLQGIVGSALPDVKALELPGSIDQDS